MILTMDKQAPEQINPEIFYSTEELAGLLDISLITAKRYIKKGIVYSTKIGGIRRINFNIICNNIERLKTRVF